MPGLIGVGLLLGWLIGHKVSDIREVRKLDNQLTAPVGSCGAVDCGKVPE